MTTNLFPDIARRWLKRLRGEPPKSETEKALDRAAAPHADRPLTDDAEPESGEARLERAARRNDTKKPGAGSTEQ